MGRHKKKHVKTYFFGNTIVFFSSLQRAVVRRYLLVCEHWPADVLQVAHQGLQVGEGAGRGVGPRVEVACF